MTAYYNEIDPFCVAWLKRLIARNLIAPGDVDERSIVEVQADDLRGYDQCHWFAGIGGWSYALRLAGWADDRPVWTGSCPCQPFSTAGKLGGSEDERHLWPAFFRLIRECRPAALMGEQVAGAAGLAWLDHVLADLEGAGYAAAAADLPACSVGAPHRRQRLWWVAQSDERQRGSGWAARRLADRAHLESSGSSAASSMADSACDGRREERENGGGRGAGDSAQRRGEGLDPSGDADRMADPDAAGPGLERRGGLFDGEWSAQRDDADPCGADDGMGDAASAGLEGSADQVLQGARGRSEGRAIEPSSPWDALVWLPCSDGKARPAQSTVQRMAPRLPDSLGYMRDGDQFILWPLIQGTKNRVGRLRGYGNAIVPQLAAEVIRAYMECQP